MVYKVTITVESGEKMNLVYRRFTQEFTDRRIELAIVESKSLDGTGPKVHYHDMTYRIEDFFNGRAISIWEMRNPLIIDKYADLICDYNFCPDV